MREYKYIEKILSNLFSERELSYLSLDKSNDNLSKLFRAFILQFFKNSPDYKNSLDVLKSEENNPSLNLFEKFFGMDIENISYNYEALSKKKEVMSRVLLASNFGILGTFL